MNTKYKISFCTVSMNRLHHLKKTLPKNIFDNLDYNNVEYVVLDYNSHDNLSEWICTEERKYLDMGILKYYKTTDPVVFNRSHSRNMCFRLATGDILCNIDADNFTGKGFAEYVNDKFQKEDDIFLTGNSSHRDTIGRVCIKKDDFMQVNGYNECIQDYGFEDNELYKRLIVFGKRQVGIEEFTYLKAIQHDNYERIANEKLNQGLKNIFVAYYNSYESDLILEYEKKVVKACIIDYITFFIKKNKIKQLSFANNLIFLKKPLQEGKIYKKNGKMIFEFFNQSNNEKIICNSNATELVNTNGKEHFYKVTDDNFKNDIILLLSEIANKQTIIYHSSNHVKVNETGFGKGIIYTCRGIKQKLL